MVCHSQKQPHKAETRSAVKKRIIWMWRFKTALVPQLIADGLKSCTEKTGVTAPCAITFLSFEVTFTCNYTCKKMWVKYFGKIGWKTDWSKADALISVVTSAVCLKGLHCAAASRGNLVVSAQGWLQDTGGVPFNLRQPCFSHRNASSGGYWLFDTQVVFFWMHSREVVYTLGLLTE